MTTVFLSPSSASTTRCLSRVLSLPGENDCFITNKSVQFIRFSFNGTNINPLTPGEGKYYNITLTPGKRHRLRLINTSKPSSSARIRGWGEADIGAGVENNFQVSILNHSMTVIAGDFVPMNAFTTSSLFVGIGQRKFLLKHVPLSFLFLLPQLSLLVSFGMKLFQGYLVSPLEVKIPTKSRSSTRLRCDH